MKYISVNAIAISLAYAVLNTTSAAVTLKESFDSALKFNQLDNINNSKIAQSEAEITIGKSGYFPKLYLKGTFTKQENLTDTRYGNLYLTQSLYRGNRDVYTTELAENTKNMAVLNKTADQINLYQNVITAYYNFYMYKNDAKNYELLMKQSSDRVNEIDKRVRIGRSRMGELLQAKAQLAQAQAQLENAQGLAREAGEKFAVLTGIRNNEPDVLINSKLNEYSFKDLLEKAYRRTDVMARELKVDEATKNLSIAKAAHLPTLDLTSNYYFTKRYGTSYAATKTNWDASLVLTFPLFEGFNSDAKVNENVQKEHEARYTVLDYKRTIELDLSSKFETHKRYVDQIKSFDTAVNLAQKSYEEAIKDYRLGLITNLDVLTALNLYLDSKRNTEKNKIQAIMTEKILEATIGNLP